MTVELDKLKGLDFKKQLAFAYLTCERLFPNYVYFSSNYDFGKPHVLREAIDFLYENIFEDRPDDDKLAVLIKRVEQNTPDTEDFTTSFVSSALDACTAVGDSLDFLLDKDFSRIEAIVTYAIDTVSMHIQEVEQLDFNTDKSFQKKINNHPLMKKESLIQQGIIAFLSSSEKVDYGDIQTLLSLQENNKKGSLDL